MLTRFETLIICVLFIAGLLLTGGSSHARSADTELGPGDVLYISLPGEETLNRTFKIDRLGRIELPEVGEVEVSGRPLGEIEVGLRRSLSTVFRDMDQFEVTLKERRKLITVLGYVNEPGMVDLPGDASVQEAITAAGGLVPGAQLDRLQLRRGSDRQVFDFKKYLDTGDESRVPEIRTLDTVFVPSSPLTGNVQVEFDARTLTETGDAAESGTAVKIFGEVRSPGAYGYKEGQSVVDLIMRAGGVTRYASVEQIRVIGAGEPRVFNLKDYLDTGNGSLLPPVGGGSTIFVPKETVGVQKGARIVYVMGEVFKPGAFEMQEGTSFLDVLANAGGPTRFADTKRVRILRGDGSAEPFDLAVYTESGGRGIAIPELQPGDSIFVPEKLDLNEKSWLKVPPQRAVYVMGQVARPGRYEWSNEMTFLDLIAHAGGPTGKADVAAIQITAKSGDGSVRSETFDMERYMAEGGNARDCPSSG